MQVVPLHPRLNPGQEAGVEWEKAVEQQRLHTCAGREASHHGKVDPVVSLNDSLAIGELVMPGARREVPDNSGQADAQWVQPRSHQTVPGKSLNCLQSLWGGCQLLVAERKDVEDCLAGRVEGTMSESILGSADVQNVIIPIPGRL